MKIIEMEGNIVDIYQRQIYPARIIIEGERIKKIERINKEETVYILPGLIDSHIHIESSMTTPASFASAIVPHGTTGVVEDPHEIANVLGIEGVKFMIEESEKVPLKFWFGAPSCVPATNFETSGARIDSGETDELLKLKTITHLAEMMNFPGVIYHDREVLNKIEIAKKYGKPIDGHAPALSGENLKKYVSAGISTDHECTTIEEAREKISLGMKIMIREGSAARNLNALKSLIKSNPDMVMLCTDDLHPEMLAKNHINKIAARLIKEGFNIFDVFKSCTINPAEHYKLNAGLLRIGDPADIIIVDNPSEMSVLETWINGEKVFDRGKVLFQSAPPIHLNRFNCSPIASSLIRVVSYGKKLRIIEAFDGELFTRETIIDAPDSDIVSCDTKNDILKIVVKDRYNDSLPAVGLIKGFSLKKGAFAASVAHDSHNIICIGADDNDIVNAVNQIIKLKGGLAVACDDKISFLPLSVAGIMSDKPVKEVANIYESLSNEVKILGCKMEAPFMTLSFMALLVIPELKLSDRGLFDGRKFSFVPLTF